jgi:hypothetical protein
MGRLLNNELIGVSKEAVIRYIEISQCLPGETEESHINPQSG